MNRRKPERPGSLNFWDGDVANLDVNVIGHLVVVALREVLRHAEYARTCLDLVAHIHARIDVEMARREPVGCRHFDIAIGCRHFDIATSRLGPAAILGLP